MEMGSQFAPEPSGVSSCLLPFGKTVEDVPSDLNEKIASSQVTGQYAGQQAE